MSAGAEPGGPPRHLFHDVRRAFLEHEDDLLAAMRRVLRSNRYILGPEVEGFEREFASFVGVPHAIGVANGTDALALALRALDVGRGARVAIPALTAIPTAMAVTMVGARPVFVDVDDATLTMDPASLERALAPDVRAVIPVHLYGAAADVPRIAAIAAAHGVPMIEDCAQSQGTKIGGIVAGTVGRLACFSFYPTKNLGTPGDAGAITTAEPALAERLRRLRFYGQAAGYDCVEDGVNSRLDELHAAILRVLLRFLPAANRRRREIAARYRREITNAAVRLPTEAEGTTHVYHQFVVRVADRDGFRAHLAARGVETMIHYPRALPTMTGLATDAARSPACPIAAKAAAEVTSLPVYPEAPDATIAATIAAVNDWRA